MGQIILEILGATHNQILQEPELMFEVLALWVLHLKAGFSNHVFLSCSFLFLMSPDFFILIMCPSHSSHIGKRVRGGDP